jgi:hypothetical protein
MSYAKNFKNFHQSNIHCSSKLQSKLRSFSLEKMSAKNISEKYDNILFGELSGIKFYWAKKCSAGIFFVRSINHRKRSHRIKIRSEEKLVKNCYQTIYLCKKIAFFKAFRQSNPVFVNSKWATLKERKHRFHFLET